ncbi:autotransporter domain protein [Campylobacter pinnipediorum subsp. caledonicus]|uniref:autotransporter outer membrane beta-barrel domain-containing protein n=1 Tax=Campylobacter pinnipediorum TaxID=1965231 RepID=UPI0009956F02|nr:autotransporter outer membrane beta-barrel domain-containing protein [Campylobacter pinnipediorum]AQW86859.1 autotransporter domain protein [Campylobacter pinnipediorum subsp. caledonicus]
MKISKFLSAVAISACLTQSLFADTYFENARVSLLAIALEKYNDNIELMMSNINQDLNGLKETVVQYLISFAFVKNNEMKVEGSLQKDANDALLISSALKHGYEATNDWLKKYIENPLKEILANPESIDNDKLKNLNISFNTNGINLGLGDNAVNHQKNVTQLKKDFIKNHKIEIENKLDEFLNTFHSKLQKNIDAISKKIKEKSDNDNGLKTELEKLEKEKVKIEEKVKEIEEKLKKEEQERLKKEKERQEEQERLEKEKKEEKEREEKERLEKERLEKEKEEREKIKKEELKKEQEFKSKFSTQDSIQSSIYDLTKDNQNLRQIFETMSKDQIQAFSKEIKQTTQDISSNISENLSTQIVDFNSEITTQTRLAQLSNPFNKDLALAKAINALKDIKFASNDDSVMTNVVKEYTDRFAYNNSLWASALGGQTRSKNNIKSSLYGFAIGYDRAFDSTIVGSYINYAKTKTKNDSFDNKADNYQVGVYTRSYVNNNEIDTKVSIGKSKNKLTRDIKIPNNALVSQKSKYDTKSLTFDLSYGYVVATKNNSFVKPFIGASYSYFKNDEFKEDGLFAMKFSGSNSKMLNASAGIEFRTYLENGNYFFITPSLQKEIYKKTKDSIVRFVGSDKDIILTTNNKKSTYVSLITGAQVNLTQNLSANMIIGAKAKSKEKLYNATIGLRYKF